VKRPGSAPRIVRRAIDGVLLLDKPLGWSSNHAVQAIKRVYRAERAGHTGTLDPLATGLLPICLGEATKFSAGLLDADKEYLADVRLGVTTRTGDAEGEVLQTRPVNVDDAHVAAALARFRGEIDQVPPMHSALKRDGKPLYEYARAGVELERAPRRVTIHALDLVARQAEVLCIRVACSKGTYVRVLAEDIGRALGCGAHLAALRRTRVGDLSVAGAVLPAAVERLDEPGRDALLAPADALVANLPEARLTPGQDRIVLRGQAVPFPSGEPGLRRIYDPRGTFLGLGERRPDGLLHPRRLLRSTEPAHEPPEILAKHPDSQ
jgi:tRNA pseudouridine55 synthase